MQTGSVVKIEKLPSGHPALENLYIRDVMQRQVSFLTADAPLDEAVSCLLDKNLTGAPVVDKDQILIGFLSLKDCLPYVSMLGIADPCHEDLTVRQIMSHEIHALSPSDSLNEALNAFLNQWFHIYPVVDQSQRLIGTLSRMQLLKCCLKNKDTK